MIIKLKTSLANNNTLFGFLQYLLDNPDENIPIFVEEVPKNTDEFEQSNPLDKFKTTSNETLLVSNLVEPGEVRENIFNIAPGEGQNPLPILNDDFCEELAHPHLFPTGKFGYKVKRNILLSPVKYFNQRLLNYTQRFASDSDYIFFANSVLQQLNLNNQINVAMKKSCF